MKERQSSESIIRDIKRKTRKRYNLGINYKGYKKEDKEKIQQRGEDQNSIGRTTRRDKCSRAVQERRNKS
jgi:hypothetical protein